MKKILLVIALLTVGGYASGFLLLSENRAITFLDELEKLSLQGKAAEYCDRLHEDMQVSLSDRSAQPAAEFAGGKRQMCDYVSYATRGLDLLGLSTEAVRENLTVTRSWLHPWTASVSYTEARITHMTKVNVTLRTKGEDQWTLVYAPGGIKVMRLVSKTQLAD